MKGEQYPILFSLVDKWLMLIMYAGWKMQSPHKIALLSVYNRKMKKSNLQPVTITYNFLEINIPSKSRSARTPTTMNRNRHFASHVENTNGNGVSESRAVFVYIFETYPSLSFRPVHEQTGRYVGPHRSLLGSMVPF